MAEKEGKSKVFPSFAYQLKMKGLIFWLWAVVPIAPATR
jgi:hypothetical protein